MPNLSMTATAEDLMPKPHQVQPKLIPLPLRKAQEYGDKIAEWIAPYCFQIEPVGEIRRRCSTCKEIELLVIPRFDEGKHLLFEFLDQYVKNSGGRARWSFESKVYDPAKQPAPKALDARLILPKCALTLHCATRETWFLRLFESTGSKAHFHTMEHWLRMHDGDWRYGRWIDAAYGKVVPGSEGEIYDLVKKPYLQPKNRIA
jgi:hypothetical protein